MAENNESLAGLLEKLYFDKVLIVDTSDNKTRLETIVAQKAATLIINEIARARARKRVGDLKQQQHLRQRELLLTPPQMLPVRTRRNFGGLYIGEETLLTNYVPASFLECIKIPLRHGTYTVLGIWESAGMLGFFLSDIRDSADEKGMGPTFATLASLYQRILI